MALTDKAFGALLLIAAAFIFSYYTAWVFVSPFVDMNNHAFHNWFPDRKWAILIPTLIFVLVVAVTAAFVGLVMIRSGKKNR